MSETLCARLEHLRDRWAKRAGTIGGSDRARGLAILQCESELAAVLYELAGANSALDTAVQQVVEEFRRWEKTPEMTLDHLLLDALCELCEAVEATRVQAAEQQG